MQTDAVNVVSARKAHGCSWCGERIEVGGAYVRYRYFDGRDAGTVKEHPECYDAMQRLCAEEGEIQFMPGDFARGCACETGCDTCKPTKEQDIERTR